MILWRKINMDEQELFANKKESAGHKIGKRIAKVLLKNKRFRTNEIKEEYPIIFPSGRIRIIDVVGISEPIGKKFAYEIGDLNGGSLDELYYLFQVVENISKINIEESRINEVINYFDESEIINKALNFEINDEKIRNFCLNEIIYSYQFLFDINWNLSDEKIEDYVKDEIDFLYSDANSRLTKNNYNKIKSRLFNYYKNMLEKEINKVKEKT